MSTGNQFEDNRQIVWIGALVLLGTFLGVKMFTELERKLTTSMLRTTVTFRLVSVFQKARTLMTTRES